MTPERVAELRRWADRAASEMSPYVHEALDEIERLEVDRDAWKADAMKGRKREAELERELADTRKANEILEAQAVAALGPVRFGPGPEVVDAAEDEARRRGRARRRK